MINLYMDDVRDCLFVGWTVVRTVREAQILLSAGIVNKCSLDHDMGACQECQNDDWWGWCPHAIDGTYLVRWMIKTGNWPAEKPTVHSANPVGAARMRALIDEYFGKPAMET